MRVRVRWVGFPEIRARLGGDRIDVDLDGTTVGDLLRQLQRDHGDPAGTRLLAPDGRPDESVQVLRNGAEPVPADALERPLSEGDEVALVVLVAGG